jgi:hypothetical protein
MAFDNFFEICLRQVLQEVTALQYVCFFLPDLRLRLENESKGCSDQHERVAFLRSPQQRLLEDMCKGERVHRARTHVIGFTT